MSGKQCRSGLEATHFGVSDLCLHCLLRPVCPNTRDYYSKYKSDSASYLLSRALQYKMFFSLLLICVFNFETLFNVLHCDFNMLNLPKRDVLGLEVALG